jgi:hypothetical protein
LYLVSPIIAEPLEHLKTLETRRSQCPAEASFAKSLQQVFPVANAHVALKAVDTVNYDILHCCLAHPLSDVLCYAWRHTKDCPEVTAPKDKHICPGCAQGKMPEQHYTPTARRVQHPFQLVHSNLKSFPVKSYHRYKYVITFVDDYTSFVLVVFLRKKDAAIQATQQFLAMVETQFHLQVEQWMSDGGGEYKSDTFNAMLKNKGIKILLSLLYTTQINGCAECFMRTIMDKAESMRHVACIPRNWWDFAVDYAVHIYNHMPVRHLQWRTP